MEKVLTAVLINLIVGLLSFNLVKAEPFPVLAQLEGGRIYVPLFEVMNQKPTNQVVFYPVYLWGRPKNSSPINAVFSEIRSDISVADFSMIRGFLTQRGLVYIPKAERVGYELGFLLPASKRLTFDQSTLEYRTPNGTSGYKVVMVSSHEGVHYILQSFQNGKCIASADYYVYAGYDTEPSPEGEFERTNCGEKISPANFKSW